MSKTLWRPRLPQNPGPIYRAIADALESDLAGGVIADGARLPTHRELASLLGVTPLTITRAYQEAARRGLIDSTVGRGTFVRRSPAEPQQTERMELDLSRNVVTGTDALELESRALGAVRAAVRDSEYHAAQGTPRHRAAAAAWIRRSGLEASAENVIITPGAQQGILTVLAAACRPGDVVLCEELTYPRFVSTAKLLNLEVEPVALDAEGLDPKALDRACRRRTARALYLIPNLQNPTGSLMPVKRRQDIARIAAKHGLTIIEDDVYGFLLSDPPPPVGTFLPEQTAFVTSASKSLSPSLRLGFVHVPESLLTPAIESFASMTAFTSTASAEIFAQLLESGAADRTVMEKRGTIERNRRAAERGLQSLVSASHQSSPHLWIELPPHVSAYDLADRARARNIHLAAASWFAVDRTRTPNAVRVSLGATPDARRLESAMRTISSLLSEQRVGPVVV